MYDPALRCDGAGSEHLESIAWFVLTISFVQLLILVQIEKNRTGWLGLNFYIDVANQDEHEGNVDMDMSAACFLNITDTTDIAIGDSNRAAFLRSILVSSYANLHRRLLRYLGCPDQASDSLHDAWLRLGEMELPEVIASPEAYVYRVACNVAIDSIRSCRPWQYTADIETTMDYLADTAPGPEVMAEIRSDINALDRVLNRLPRHHQDILKCLRLEDFTRQQVANRHGISLRSVDTMLRQALDYCANQTGQTAVGGVSTPRRSLPQHSFAKPDAAFSFTGVVG